MNEKIRWSHCLGLLLLSFATLLLELSMTRVLSVALWYHFGFLIISTALLGFGAAGVVLSLWKKLRESIPLDSALAALALCFSVATVLCFWLLQRIPFDPFSLLTDRRQLLFMPLYYMIISLPFFCSGLGLAVLFSRGANQIHRLYAFDLLGAGLGCAALALVMPVFKGSGTVVVAAAIGLLAAAVFAIGFSVRRASVCVALSLGAFGLAMVADRVLPISVAPNKALSIRTHPALYTAWNSFSLIDVYQTAPGPRGAGTPGRSSRRFIFDAGTAATGMQDLSPDVGTFLAKNSDDHDYLSGIAYVGKEHPKVLVIGSGAGAQVLDALHFGARDITAVELNPIVNDVVSRRMKDYWGGLFQRPEVHLITEEGRSFVRRSGETYDAIISAHTISNAAIASGALALSENYVLTREAFVDYLDHLQPDGVIYFTRPEVQIARLFTTAREVLAERGIRDPSTHLYAYRIPSTDNQRRNRPAFVAGFLLKKSPFSIQELARIEDLLGIGRPPRSPDQPTPQVLYSPLARNPQSLYDRILTADDLHALYATDSAELEPATDNRPFFNHHIRWRDIGPGTFRDLFSQQRLGRLALEDRPVAEVTLLVLLFQSIVIAAAFIVLPLARFSRKPFTPLSHWRYMLYFAGLGLGFIMIELALLSRFTLFLGQPVYTFSVVLASLLIYTGVGASIAPRLFAAWRQSLPLVIGSVVLTLAATSLLLPLLFSAALGLALIWRIVVAVLALAPLGIMLGLPFPIGLGQVFRQAPILVAWCWGINGFFTVIGTVAAMIFGMTWGFNFVLLGGGLCYLTAMLAIAGTETQRTVPASGVRGTDGIITEQEGNEGR